MKSVFNLLILAALLLAWMSGTVLFGGILPAEGLVFYLASASTLLIWALKWLTCRHVSWAWSPLHIPVILFTLYAFALYLQAPVESSARWALWVIGLAAGAYFTASQNLYRKRDRLTLVYATGILAAAEAVYAVTQFRGGDMVLWLDRSTDYHGRGSGTFYCPNHLAGFLAMALCLGLGRFVTLREPEADLQSVVLRRLYESVFLAVILFGLYSTMSRGGWIAAGAGLLAMLVFADISRALSSRVTISLFVILMIAVMTVWNLPNIRHRIEQSIGIDIEFLPGESPATVKEGVAGRLPIWRSTLPMIRDYPLIGVGPGQWQWRYLQYRQPDAQVRPEYVHNDWLQLTAEYGLIGLIMVLAGLGCALWQAFQVARHGATHEERAFAVGVASALAAISVHSLVDFNLHIPSNAMLLAICLGALAGMGPGNERRWRRQTPFAAKLCLGAALLLLAGVITFIGLRWTLAHRAANEAYEASQYHDWGDAEAAFERALRHDARLPLIHILRGDMYRIQSAQTTDPELRSERALIARRAILTYQIALTLNPFHSEVFLKLASAYELAGDFPAAFHAYEQALAVDPNNSFNWKRLGQFYHRRGDLPKALTALERARQLRPSDNSIPPLLDKIRDAVP